MIESEESESVMGVLQYILNFLGFSAELTDHIVRKAAHFAEYTAIGILLVSCAYSFSRTRPHRYYSQILFAGLATVADCMILKEGNWGLVKRAIRTFRNKKAPQSLKNLLILMKQDPNFCNEDYFGYYLGPAFNAPGRLMDKGAVEVLKYLHTFTEVGSDRDLQCFTVGSKHRTAHTCQLTHLCDRTTGTGVGHYLDRVVLIKAVLKCGVAWFLSYSGAYIVKWSAASLVTGENKFAAALTSVEERLVGEAEELDPVAQFFLAPLANISTLFGGTARVYILYVPRLLYRL